MKNNTWREIGELLQHSARTVLFPHVHPDGDAVGSCVALCSALRRNGSACYVLLEDPIPGNLTFLDPGCCVAQLPDGFVPEVSVCVDCGDAGRFPKRREVFARAAHTVCIDHHATTDVFCEYHYVDSNAAATGELIYQLLTEMGWPIDRAIGEALYAALVTDTGRFQYSNTSARTHEIVAQLYRVGIRAGAVCTELYESERMEKLLIRNRALSTLSTVCDGKGAIAYVTREMFAETGALADEADGVAEELRGIRGVEISAFLKEAEAGTVRVSFRSKAWADVAAIAGALGGGGHARAAGCTIHGSLAEAYDQVKEKMTACLEQR